MEQAANGRSVPAFRPAEERQMNEFNYGSYLQEEK
jgi:hypothetical protein